MSGSELRSTVVLETAAGTRNSWDIRGQINRYGDGYCFYTEQHERIEVYPVGGAVLVVTEKKSNT